MCEVETSTPSNISLTTWSRESMIGVPIETLRMTSHFSYNGPKKTTETIPACHHKATVLFSLSNNHLQLCSTIIHSRKAHLDSQWFTFHGPLLCLLADICLTYPWLKWSVQHPTIWINLHLSDSTSKKRGNWRFFIQL